MDDGGLLFPGIVVLWALGALVGLALLGFWIWALVDCLQRDFPEPLYKVMWVLVIIFLQVLGAILYVIIGRSQGTRQERAR